LLLPDLIVQLIAKAINVYLAALAGTRM